MAKTPPLPLEWAAAVLGAPLEKVEDIAVTPYSHVARLTAVGKIFYLKRTPPSLFIEAKILTLLQQDCAGTVPKLIVADETNCCFLLASCGDETLRSVFKTDFNPPLFAQGISCYRGIQTASVARLAEFASAGAPDWGLTRFSSVLDTLLADKTALAAWNVNVTELAAARKQLPGLCDALAAYGLADVLNHSDFQDNNIVIDHATGKISVIDWGEVTTGHPLLPLVACVAKAAGRYGVDGIVLKQLQRSVLDGRNIPESGYAKIWSIALPLADLYYVFTLIDLMRRSGGGYPGWGQRIAEGFARFATNSLTAAAGDL